MDTEKFWYIIEEANQHSIGDPVRQHELLIDKLSNLNEEEIQNFDRILWGLLTRAYRADLWEAVSIIACACGGEAFLDFRGWLIARGQMIFEKVLEDPENLADIVDKQQRLNIFDADIPYIADDAYELKTGQPLPRGEYPGKVILIGGPLLPERERPSKYPRIISKLGECEGDEWLR